MSLVMRGAITAGSRTDGDVGLSPPVIVEPAVMGGASPPVQKPLFRTGGDYYFLIKKYI